MSEEKLISEEELQLILKAHANNQVGDETILHVFYKLAEHVFEHIFAGKPHRFKDLKPVVKDAADLCLAKMHRYRSDKGKAFNFFTTIMTCSLRQSNGMLRSLEKLKNARRN